MYIFALIGHYRGMVWPMVLKVYTYPFTQWQSYERQSHDVVHVCMVNAPGAAPYRLCQEYYLRTFSFGDKALLVAAGLLLYGVTIIAVGILLHAGFKLVKNRIIGDHCQHCNSRVVISDHDGDDYIEHVGCDPELSCCVDCYYTHPAPVVPADPTTEVVTCPYDGSVMEWMTSVSHYAPIAVCLVCAPHTDDERSAQSSLGFAAPA